MKPPLHRRWRQLRASLRDTGLLLREFGWPLLFFNIAVLGGGWLYHRISIYYGEPVGDLSAAVYHVLTLVFLNSLIDYPASWPLRAFYFLMPIIGIGLLAQGVADFGVLFFNRRARGKEWEMAVASTFSNHVVLVGLGHLGYRVVHHLHSLEQDVVAIDIHPQPDIAASVRSLGVPVLTDDATREAALVVAGIRKARAIILCTQQDGLNLQVAMKARALNPEIRVVIRIFDDEFAKELTKQFGFKAISNSATASPLFAAAAAGVDMTHPIVIEGQALSLARLQVAAGSQLTGKTVGEIEREFEVSVVVLRNAGKTPEYHPEAGRQIHPGDVLAILGGAAQISHVANHNRSP